MSLSSISEDNHSHLGLEKRQRGKKTKKGRGKQVGNKAGRESRWMLQYEAKHRSTVSKVLKFHPNLESPR